MTHEDVLRHLHRVVGKRVSVHLGGARDQLPELLTVLRGTLLRGTVRRDGEPLTDDERVVFDVGDSSFVIAREEFVSAELLAGDQSLLHVQLGGCDLQVSTIAGT